MTPALLLCTDSFEPAYKSEGVLGICDCCEFECGSIYMSLTGMEFPMSKLKSRLAKILPAGWRVISNDEVFDEQLEIDARALCTRIYQEYYDCLDFTSVGSTGSSVYMAEMPGNVVIDKAKTLAKEFGFRFEIESIDPPAKIKWRSAYVAVWPLNPTNGVFGPFPGTPESNP